MEFDKILDELVKNYGLKYFIYNDENHRHLPLAVRLELKIADSIYESWGVSKDKDLAFFKATMEIVERISLRFSCPIHFKNGLFNKALTLAEISEKFHIKSKLLWPENSNGMAIGISRRMAKKNALKELVERHTILTALLMNISPKKVPSSLKPKFLIDNHKFDFYFWESNNFFIVVCVDRLHSGGFLTTYACSHSLQEAVKRSFEEIVPNIIWANSNSVKKEKVVSITKNNIMSFSDYWRYSGDERLLDFFNGSGKSNLKIPKLKNIYFGECLIPEEFKMFSFSVFCYRAISPEAQQLFFDNWDEHYINPKYSHFRLPEYPHFIS